ncbi:uncharacterized protein LAJ45_09100 [Morchella importuna]|uniref:uncharacterized protein n=1 Tax=Morchella importuna TaxID=1174673 RepID=UPI001E8CF12C|nr:uncharacterized protein LAJ45_09100 [Morchella importuna]KAH8146726.1 hypothetical protein LAJ45_09100 [Morchella importuna]
MAGRRSPPLAFIAPPTLPSFSSGTFALQQVPPNKLKRGDSGHDGAPPFETPFSSSTDTVSQALASLHEKYHNLLSHERQGKDLERSIWESERLLFIQRIAELEGTVRELQGQLDIKPRPEDQPAAAAALVVNAAPAESQSNEDMMATTKDLPDGLVDVAAPRIDVESKGGKIVEQVIEMPSNTSVAHEESPLDYEANRADTPGLSEYPYPKTPKSVKGDVEPDESEIVNLLDQAGRILGKAIYQSNAVRNTKQIYPQIARCLL